MYTAFTLGLPRNFVAACRPNLLQPRSQSLHNAFHNSRLSSQLSTRRSFSIDISKSVSSSTRSKSSSLFYNAAGVAGVGIGLSIIAAPTIFCEPPVPRSSTQPISQPSGAALPSSEATPPPPASSVSYYELTFGTVAGVCAGVFVKKGAKALAFVLGGVFVLLQYLGSLSLVRVDWSRAATRFENLFYTKDATGKTRAPSVGSLFRWISDFLTADFQQRASFVAGFALGLRIG